jgi:hypothetical protein
MNTDAIASPTRAHWRSSLGVGAAVLVLLAAAALGFVLGFGFARSAGGGFWMGTAAGLNGALFCTLLADWVGTRLARRPPA